MNKLPVIFRKESDGSILAVFPTQAESYAGYHMLCYAHIGQHGTCSLEYYRETKPAKPDEYAPLLAELTAIYTTRPMERPDIYGEPVKLVVSERRSAAMQSEWLRQSLAMGAR